MAIKVRCQQCGKTSQYFASDAGLTALCVACGARFTVPSESEQSAAADDAAPPGAPFATSAHDDDAAAALAARQAVAPAPPIKPLPISIGAPNTSGPYNATPGLLDRVAELAPPKIGADAIAPPPEGDQPLTPPRIPTAPPRQFNAPLLFTALGGALALIIVLATVLILRSNPTWEDQNRAAVRDLKARA